MHLHDCGNNEVYHFAIICCACFSSGPHRVHQQAQIIRADFSILLYISSTSHSCMKAVYEDIVALSTATEEAQVVQAHIEVCFGWRVWPL